MTTNLLEVLTPADAGYDAARAPWNLSVDQRPALIVDAASADDVADAVRLAVARNLKVAPQGTGHRATALPALDDALLLRTAQMNAVTIDPVARTARVGAGALWRDVIDAAAAYGLAAPHGFAPGVGVTGYVLGGGLGWLARSHGFGSSFVRGFDVVTATGEVLRVDDMHEPGLFWALRGGGSCGVVVTAVELELVALREVYAGTLLWPFEHASTLVQAYREWMDIVPTTLTSSLRLMRFPPLPQLPELVRGRSLVQLSLALQGSKPEGDALVAPLRASAPALHDTLAIVPAAALGDLAGDPEDSMPAATTSLLLRSLTAAAGDAFVALASPSLTMLELRHLGGALRSQPGAIGGVGAQALVFASGVPAAPQLSAALTVVRAGLAPWTHARGTLPTFDDDGRRANVASVAAIASAYDPDARLLSA
jgi:FAD/FMN-containing dehydrogenase